MSEKPIEELTGGQEESPSFAVLPIAKNNSISGNVIAFKKQNMLSLKQMPSKYAHAGSQDMPTLTPRGSLPVNSAVVNSMSMKS